MRKLISPYTNCILTCVWADGVDRTPPILFTYNKNFIKKVRRGEYDIDVLSEEAQDLCDLWGLDEDQVCYIQDFESPDKKFVAEHQTLIEHFMWKVYSHITWFQVYKFMDAGQAFKKAGLGEYICQWQGGHFVYPSPVHHLLSPNDNNQHGIGKKKWNSVEDHKDDVFASLFLLKCLMEVDKDTIIGFWKTNFCVGLKGQERAAAVKNFISKNQFGRIRRDPTYSMALEMYMNYAEKNRRNSITTSVHHMGDKCDLDGRYWAFHN